ncbi:transmembrane protein 216-like [Paramacrobiotus metropolitanus]|uniref:transmembrane protein 216-like n=1 Tax=Paramacrobiotus metropolitanus TaxID=2943436 RepID=UPI0024460418|nr:transmembrane protein 216-like [Paramacrobiotus metropolitanus]
MQHLDNLENLKLPAFFLKLTVIHKMSSSANSYQFSGKIFTSRAQQNTAVMIAVLFGLNKLYDCVFIIFQIVLYIYKGLRLPYEPSDIGLEAALLAVLLILDALRFAFGTRGYLTQKTASLSLAFLLTPAALLIGLHVMFWQTYVTFADYVLGAILIAIHSAELLALLLAILLCASRRSLPSG